MPQHYNPMRPQRHVGWQATKNDGLPHGPALPGPYDKATTARLTGFSPNGISVNSGAGRAAGGDQPLAIQLEPDG